MTSVLDFPVLGDSVVDMAQDVDDVWDMNMGFDVQGADMAVDCQNEQEPPVAPPVLDIKNTNTVIVFDWDDTLLPSSWLTSTCGLDKTINDLSPAYQSELIAHAGLVANLISAAQQYGNVVIITNAETGWVQFSSERFMPSLVSILEGIQCISARSTYEPQFPEPGEWKINAFHNQIQSYNTPLSQVLNVVSFGDGEFEREAALTAGRRVNASGGMARTKSIKFIERPSVEHLGRQVELIADWLNYIVTIENDLDLMLTVSLLS
eukprot:gnl/Spiro4/4511_TR2241_c0_g1_i1.p1 gnl/Spiro4/4511_TR2241_c0_g1~~gnl/Spiro4/4511_TR2241_c0_g1_i1.p1  ORF type:complete len:264 (+),score=43.68 gnl/Spiro4/4511_TR2241_c0_g1_i1:100-891(+)